MTSNYLVTVIMPVYNAGEYLKSALESILSQTYENLEIIIVDDGSTDNCIESVQSYIDNEPRIVFLEQKNSGKSVAINNAFKIMNGDFWLIQDADDLSYPDRVEKQLQYLCNNPEVAAVYIGHDLILNNTRFAPKYEKLSPDECVPLIESFKMPAHDATGMYRVTMVKEMRYDPELRIGQGIDFVLRTGEKHPIALLGKCLYSYRINYNSTIRKDPAKNIEKINLVIKKTCERRNLDFNDHKLNPGSEYKNKKRSANNHLISHCMDSVICLKRDFKLMKAVKIGIICAKLNLFDHYNYKPLIYSLTPLFIISHYKKRRQGGVSN